MVNVRVSNNLKGEIALKTLNRTFKAGSVFSVDEDNFLKNDIQMAVKSGFLILVDGEAAVIEKKIIKIRNRSSSAVVLKNMKRIVPSGHSIFINENDLSDISIKYGLSSGILEDISDIKEKEEVPVEIVDKKSSKPRNKTAKKVAKKVKSNKKTKKDKENKSDEENTDIDNKSSNIYIMNPNNQNTVIPKANKTSCIDFSNDNNVDMQ